MPTPIAIPAEAFLMQAQCNQYRAKGTWTFKTSEKGLYSLRPLAKPEPVKPGGGCLSLKTLVLTSLLASGLIPLANAQQAVSFTATEGKITRIGSTAIPAASPFGAAAPLSQPNIALHRTVPKPD